jgi:hypothetical protein
MILLPIGRYAHNLEQFTKDSMYVSFMSEVVFKNLTEKIVGLIKSRPNSNVPHLSTDYCSSEPVFYLCIAGQHYKS